MRRWIFILISILTLSACHSGGQKDDALSDVDIKVIRYDRLQYEAFALNSFSALQKMSTECPQATKLLIERVLDIGRAKDTDINERLCAYYSDSILQRIMEDATLVKFKNMKDIEKGLTEGFRKLKKELPDLVIPQVYSQVSALNQSVVVGDSLLGFSIDKYMGADYPLYKRYYYNYQLRAMNPDCIVPDCLMSYLYSQYPFPWEEGNRTLFDIMIYHGKVAWVMDKILNYDTESGKLLNYTAKETEWCQKNISSIWKWMKERNHLSSTDPMLIRAYTHPDPSVIFGGKKVPPFLGTWMGVQLVDAYMSQHKEVTVQQLLQRKDCHTLLQEMDFNP